MARLNFLGFVISQGKMEKTIKVRVLQKKFDNKVQKHFLQKKDYLVHDEGNITREGDLVRIEQTRPLSAKKFFAVAEIKKNKGQQFATYQKEAKTNVQKEETEKSAIFDTKKQLFQNNVNESLYKDLSLVEDLRVKKNLSEEEMEKIQQIKEKYNVSRFSEDGLETPLNKELFNPTIVELSEKIDNLSFDLKLRTTLNSLLSDESKKAIVAEISEKMKITPETKKNIKKNLVRKYLKTAPAEELERLGLSI
jgi:small subunit ribosomal protein S17